MLTAEDPDPPFRDDDGPGAFDDEPEPFAEPPLAGARPVWFDCEPPLRAGRLRAGRLRVLPLAGGSLRDRPC